MAAISTVGNLRVYTHIKDQLAPVSGTAFPGAAANMTNFRALHANMANAAFLVIAVDNGTTVEDYAIPLLLKT